MKKIITTFVATAIALSASAVIDGDGYYRVQNNKTGRYIYVLDDKGELNFQATTAELGAIQLWKYYDKTISDPATVIYVKDLNGKQQDFDLQTQGTGVKAIINYPVSIRLYNKTEGTYQVFGRNSGLTRYIGDATTSSSDRGYVTSDGNGEYYRWLFYPVTTDDSNYFGITPEFQEGSDYYSTLYADFPFSFHSAGMKAYYVTWVNDGIAYICEIEGTVPQGTPVIIRSSSDKASENRLNIGGSANKISQNILKGVYFNNTSLLHKNLTENDKATMRVLGRLSDGSIGFVTSSEKYLPRNKAYLVVPAGTPAELKIQIASSGIDEIAADSEMDIMVNGLTVSVSGNGNADIYNVTGRLVGRTSDGSFTLPSAGVYVVKAGTTVRKIMAK